MKATGADPVAFCELCGEPLDADSVYGTDDMNLCRGHHQLFYDMLYFLMNGPTPQQQAELKQLSMFAEAANE